MSDMNIHTAFRRGTGVRKRCCGGEVFLIRLTEIHKIDSFTEEVWSLIDGRKTLYEVSLALRHGRDVSETQLIETLFFILNQMASSKLVEISEPGFLCETEKRKVEANRARLAGIMQRFYSRGGQWDSDTSVGAADKMIKRFFRILYEMYESAWTSEIQTPLTEEGFKELWARRFFLCEESSVRELRTTYALAGWYHSVQENRIVIRYQDTVYTGDLDNRL